MSDNIESSGFKTNRTLLELKWIRKQIKFMEDLLQEEMSKPQRKRLQEHIDLTKQIESAIMVSLQETGGVLK